MARSVCRVDDAAVVMVRCSIEKWRGGGGYDVSGKTPDRPQRYVIYVRMGQYGWLRLMLRRDRQGNVDVGVVVDGGLIFFFEEFLFQNI